MTDKHEFNSQFSMGYNDYLEGIDLSNWFRYYFIIKEVIEEKPKSILEIGVGNKIVKNCLKGLVKNYQTMDINPKLNPDILLDLRETKLELKEKFDCLICAEVLEHMSFSDLDKNLFNIHNYLDEKGKAIITIPHRRARFMMITPFSYYKPLIITLPVWIKSSPKLFYQQVIKNNVWIDPNHCWEIGDGKIKEKDIKESIGKAGFSIKKFKKLLHVDFFVLEKISD